MRIQTFVRSRGPDFRVFQVAFYKVDEKSPADYLLTKMTGRLPSGTVNEFFSRGEWFTDLMSFASRENHLGGGRSFTHEEASRELARWRKVLEPHGFGDEREYMDGVRVQRTVAARPQS